MVFLLLPTNTLQLPFVGCFFVGFQTLKLSNPTRPKKILNILTNINYKNLYYTKF